MQSDLRPPLRTCAAFRELPGIVKANVFGLAAAIGAFSILLWPLWRSDQDLAHGIYLPVLFAILVRESRRDPAPRFLTPGAASLAACAALALAGLAGLACATAYAAAFGWSHAMAEFLLATTLVLVLGAAWLACADRRVRAVPLNWAAAAAILLWLFASPPPPGTYARLSLFLQAEVTQGVVRVLNAFDIAAWREGTVIDLPRTRVGVSEACSGVRSLISCAVTGLFLSAILVRRLRHRLAVVALAPALGLAMNFLRSLLLTLLANGGVSIEGRVHDFTGTLIIAGTTLLVAALGLGLRRRERVPVGEGSAAGPEPTVAWGSSLQAVLAVALILMAIAGAGLLAASRVPDGQAASGWEPDLAALLPGPPPGWTVRTSQDLGQYSGILRTSALVERSYFSGTAPGSLRLTLYVAYWRPGQAPVSLVNAHTPDTCWPGTGWEPVPVPAGRADLAIGDRTLAPAECRIFAYDRIRTHVWFWHLYGGRPLGYVDPFSARRFLGLSWRYGLGRTEDQLFVRVSSNGPWEAIASQTVLRQFFANLKPLGL